MNFDYKSFHNKINPHKDKETKSTKSQQKQWKIKGRAEVRELALERFGQIQTRVTQIQARADILKWRRGTEDGTVEEAGEVEATLLVWKKETSKNKQIWRKSRGATT